MSTDAAPAALAAPAAYIICECPNPRCRLRYPSAVQERAAKRCPACGAPVTVVHRLQTPAKTPRPAAPADPAHAGGWAALLDNVRSLFNVGSIFRSADGAGFHTLYLCGITPTPANPKLAKTALGAEQSVTWTSRPNAVDLAHELIAAGHTLWALEEADGAESLFAAPAPPRGLVLVVGSEVTGIDPDLLRLCERTLAIPMQGTKRSLNVATAFGVAAVVLSERVSG